MIDFLIPLGGGTKWDNNELRYALRSLDENIKFEWRPIVVGMAEHRPEWYIGIYVVVDRPVTNVKFENYRDTLNKLRWYANNHEGEFVYTYDDTCLLKPVYDVHYIVNMPLECERSEYKQIRTSKHGRTITKSMEILERIVPEDMVLYIYETHLPRRYDCKLLRELFSKFDPDGYEPPYAPATLYFNYYQPDTYIPIEVDNPWKAGFYGEDEGEGNALSNNVQRIEQAVQDKMYVNYNNFGLQMKDNHDNEPLKTWLRDRWPDKSKFEL